MKQRSGRQRAFAWFTRAHKERVRSRLESLIKGSSLPELLVAGSSWAIVGGAVRDTLLTKDIATLQMWTLWPDVDIAVEGEGRVEHDLCIEIERRQLTISRNTFGGMRVCGDELGKLDVWCMCLTSGCLSPRQAWSRYLERLDFVQNAVAFVWPQCELVIHSHWENMVRKREVTSLGHAVGPAQLQPIRAMALAVKLGMITESRFRLDQTLQRELAKLVRESDESQSRYVVSYLQDKLSSCRWPADVLDRFLEECVAIVPSKSFVRVTNEVLLKGQDAVCDWDSACYTRTHKRPGTGRARARQGYLWDPQSLRG